MARGSCAPALVGDRREAKHAAPADLQLPSFRLRKEELFFLRTRDAALREGKNGP